MMIQGQSPVVMHEFSLMQSTLEIAAQKTRADCAVEFETVKLNYECLRCHELTGDLRRGLALKTSSKPRRVRKFLNSPRNPTTA